MMPEKESKFSAITWIDNSRGEKEVKINNWQHSAEKLVFITTVTKLKTYIFTLEILLIEFHSRFMLFYALVHMKLTYALQPQLL